MRGLIKTFGTVIVCAAAFISCGGGGGSAPVEKKIVRLNEVLTNEMSEMEDLRQMDMKVLRYMSKWQLHGAQLTIMRNDSLLFSKGYGFADEEKNLKMLPSTIMRVASVSKLITAAGIMKLQEMGKLTLRDTVFGEHGILRDPELITAKKDKNYYRITVEDLLRHEAGFTGRGGDPMFSTKTIMMQNRLEEAPSAGELVRIVTKRRLGFRPGTSHSYSNFGYLLLSMIIEEVTGENYERWIRRNILEPAGCYEFKIANNYYKDRHKHESRYYVPDNEPLVDEFNNSGRMVERCYGGNDIHALAGAGAWVASSAELARFVASIDGKPTVPDILTKKSVEEMTRYIDKRTFSLGWNDTDPKNGWVRTGTFSGTGAVIKYYPDGECWIFVTNTSTWKGPSHARYTNSLFGDLRRQFSEKLPKRNMFI